MDTKKALKWVLFWMAISLMFNSGIYVFMGKEKALEYFGGYVIEFSLSMDNLFLFLLIFEAFKVQPIYQRRVLNYGIFGAVILRFIFTMLGISIVNQFNWILYIFGGVLLISGVNMMFKKEEKENFNNSNIIKVINKIIPVTNRLYGEKFFVRINKVFYATPLFAILVIIEGSDIIFAIDSIPAIFSITTNPVIVYTSNIFAILGLRSLYFILEKLHSSFQLVKYGVALILIFTGVKLLLLFFNVEVPLVLSLIIIFSILGSSIILSKLLSLKSYVRNRKIRHY